MNVLLVDDNRDYRFLMNLALTLGGYATYCAEDGMEAIEILESTDISLIISDIRMPRMDGFRLNAYARATSKYKATKFIFVSGFKEIYADTAVLDPRLDFFLDKTTPSEEIVQLVNRLLNQEPPAESSDIPLT